MDSKPMSLQKYLDNHYLTLGSLAKTCGIRNEELQLLVDQAIAPAPSYIVVSDSTCISQAFGELKASGLKPGEYFHPGNKKWVILASNTQKSIGLKQAKIDLKQQFTQNYAHALKTFDSTIFRLQDSFSPSGKTIDQGLNERTDAAWDYFLKGVFSLCVADPSSEKSIALKEILQEALITITNNGQKTHFTRDQKTHILDLIKQYAEAAMPFSPIEYPNSSRKRLAEDLRAKLTTNK
jgi:hypothetical protein